MRRAARFLAHTCAALLLALAVPAQAGETLRIGASESQRSHEALIRDVMREAGIDASIEFMPAARTRHEFLRGEIDAEFYRLGSVIDTDYPADTLRIGPLHAARIIAFVRAGEPGSASLPNLLARPVGHIRGSRWLENWLKERKIVAQEVSNRDSLYKMLLAKRIDVVLDQERLSKTYLAETGLASQVTPTRQVLIEEGSYFLLSPRRADLAMPLRKAFERWQADGRWNARLRAINREHGLPEGLGLLAPAQKTGH